jgi:YhcH/YjgK/YiaL family protein
MKHLLILLSVFLLGIQLNYAQCSKKKAEKSYAKGEWLNGIKFTPHSSINKVEFMAQYNKNKAFWDKAFAFLKETSLDTIRPGKYPIDGENVYASVTENPTKDMATTKWEFHKKYIDVQMIIKGKEKMGIVPFSKTKVVDAYNDKKDVGFASYDGGDYYTVEPGTFLIFLPSDAHRPSIKLDGCDTDKKIVIKIKYN